MAANLAGWKAAWMAVKKAAWTVARRVEMMVENLADERAAPKVGK